MNKEDLIRFEEEVIEKFKNKEIYSPLHLSGSVDGKLEDFLIDLFKGIKKEDWVFSTYRSHYHALLKGIPEKWLMSWILRNKSIHVMNKEYKFVTSALVGGVLSQAVGTAMAIKQRKGRDGVYCFIGDMTASLGVFSDCFKYVQGHDLPIIFVVEDNGLSTDTPTGKTWGWRKNDTLFGGIDRGWRNSNTGKLQLIHVKYERKYAHYGIEKQGEERSFFLT